MPKRTNRFQKLVYLFKQQLAGQATVTESKELLDRVTGANVEVDVCIETKVGGDDLTIAVECTKRGRKATVGWVNEMLSKHESLPINLLVLASASGFVRNAKAKAQSKGAKLIYLSTVSEATVRSLIGELKGMSLAVFQMSMEDVRVRLCTIGEHPQMVVSMTHDYSVYTSDGVQIGTVGTLCDELRASPAFLKGVDRKPTNGKKFFVVEWQPLRNGEPLNLQSDFGSLHPIDRIRMTGTFEIRTTELNVRNQSLDGMQIAWGEGKMPFLGDDIVMLKTTDSTGLELVSGAVGPIFLPTKKIDADGILQE